jgi:putative superfamily III holin-X
MASHTENERARESTAELVKDLSRDISQLVREEIALAKAEMTEKGRKAGAGAGMLSGAAVLGLAAVGGSMAFFILVLAALIVTAVYAAGAAVLGLRGRERLSEAAPAAPERTIESVKEDVQWAKTRATSNGE